MADYVKLITDLDNQRKQLREEVARLKHDNERLRECVRKAAILAKIAYDWDLGTDNRVEIDGSWVSTAGLQFEFKAALKKEVAND